MNLPDPVAYALGRRCLSCRARIGEPCQIWNNPAGHVFHYGRLKRARNHRAGDVNRVLDAARRGDVGTGCGCTLHVCPAARVSE